MNSSGVQSSPVSTANPCSLRNSIPSAASFSLTRTLFDGVAHSATSLLQEDLLGGAHRGAPLDVVAELGEHHLDDGEADDDVGGAEVAAVPKAEDLALEAALAAGQPDAVAVARQLADLAAVDAGRHLDGRHRVGRGVVGAEQLEAQRLDALFAAAAEHGVALEDGRQALGADHLDRLVQHDEQRDGRGERRLAVVAPCREGRPSRSRSAGCGTLRRPSRPCR